MLGQGGLIAQSRSVLAVYVAARVAAVLTRSLTHLGHSLTYSLGSLAHLLTWVPAHADLLGLVLVLRPACLVALGPLVALLDRALHLEQLALLRLALGLVEHSGSW